MHDMSHSPKEDKEGEPISLHDTTSKYPYGLCISLDDDQLTKLDMEKPSAGDMIHIFGMAKVTSVSEREDTDGKSCCRVELQITHLGLENEDEEEGEMEDD